jgi:hypothetical protein
MKRSILICLAYMAVSSSAMWASNIYGDNATGGTPYIYVMNSATMAVTRTITNLSSINGRGVVVVGNTLYYTTATSPSVYSYNLTTGVDNGALFTVAGSSALSTMAFDGTNFWIGDYSGTNQAYLYSPTGVLLKTISLADCTGHCDGLEYFIDPLGNARLISNEGDGETPGVYDVYDTNGNLITQNFINTGTAASGTGIAFDGTDFYVSNIFQGTISLYNTAGVLQSTKTITGYTGGYTPLVEDLSVDYSLVLPPSTPEPATFLTFGAGLFGLCWAAKRRRKLS